MADFDQAYDAKIPANEGGYDNDRNDHSHEEPRKSLLGRRRDRRHLRQVLRRLGGLNRLERGHSLRLGLRLNRLSGLLRLRR